MAFYNSMQNQAGFNNLFLDTVPVTLGTSYGDYLGMNAQLNGTIWFPAVGSTGFTGPVSFSSLTVTGGSTFGGPMRITDSTQSTSTTTGALVVTGGVGIGKNLWVGGTGGINMINDNTANGGFHILNTSTGSNPATDGTSLYMDNNLMYLDNRETVSSAIRFNLAGAIREQMTSLETAAFSPNGSTRTSVQDAGILDEVIGITREILDNTSSRIYSPGGTAANLTISETEASVTFNGVLRNRVNINNSEILSPDGSNELLVNNSSVGLLTSAVSRFIADSTSSRVYSPTGVTGLEVNNNGVIATPILFLNKSENTDLTNFNQVQFHNASTFPAFSGGSALNNTLIASKHTSGTTITGGGNVLLGSMTSVLSSGSNNVIIGDTTTGDAVTSGSSNIIIGQNAGSAITTVGSNICIGGSAGAGINGAQNVIIGTNSMSGTNNSASVAQNVCIGERAGDNLTTSGNNTLVGYNAGINMTTGVSNTFIGHNAGNTSNATSKTSGTCTLIGKDSDLADGTAWANSSAIGYLATVSASNQVTLGNSSITSVIPGSSGICNLGSTTNKFLSMITSALYVNVTTQTGSYTILDTDYLIIHTASSNLDVTLPSAANQTGRVLHFIDFAGGWPISSVSSNVYQIVLGTPAATTTITTGQPGEFATLISDGTYWVMVANIGAA